LDIAAAMAHFPFAGRKDSFSGTMHGQGRHALRFFTDSKVVITRWQDSKTTATSLLRSRPGSRNAARPAGRVLVGLS
jgi:hypothetical protein